MSKIQNLKTEINQKAFNVFESLNNAVVWFFIAFLIYFLIIAPKPPKNVIVEAEINSQPQLEDKTVKVEPKPEESLKVLPLPSK
jgi:hypothetical protein